MEGDSLKQIVVTGQVSHENNHESTDDLTSY